jgi:7,8-dihydropterin-6-yl-methyl-4-(beta-D-ribofuranosyl)aminobenzene 5'-phosphate synthase
MSAMKSTFCCGVLHAILAGVVCSSAGAVSPPDNSITAVSSHPPGKSKAEVFVSGGLSTYVKVNGQVILFDTGGEAASLVQNLDELGLDVSAIDAIVLSHSKGDHVSDLTELLKAAEMNPKIYVPAAAGEATSQRDPGATVIAVAKPTRVIPDAWLVGPIQLDVDGKTFDKQALVLDQTGGLVVIVGCSHPGIAEVVQQVKEVFGHRRIHLVVGGFHLQKTSKDEIREISLKLQQKGVKSLALSNCTGDPAMKIFRQEWGDRVMSFDRGETIDF